MYTLGFGILWTALAAVLVLLFRQQPEFQAEPAFFKIAMNLMPFFGFLLIRDGLRRIRRVQSVIGRDTAEGPRYEWREFNGTRAASSSDPRPAWDAEDRDFSG